MVLCALNSIGQDLGSVSKKDLLKTNGGLNVSAVFYDANGIPLRRDPFFWMINANVTFTVAGVAVPFSATFTSQESQLSQPFNQYGLSPKYKAVTAHLGFRSLNYSTFSLAGIQFLGAGIEYEPEKKPIYASVIYGRLLKAVDPVALAQSGVAGTAAYERWGYGAKIGYDTKIGDFGLSWFRAKDDPNSIGFVPPEEELTPAANLVVALTGKNKITPKTNFSWEYAYSIYTDDLRLGEERLDAFTYADNLGSIIPVNQSTTESNALKAAVTQQIKSVNLNLTYQRIDPNYQSMGTPFINNDFENITGGFTTPLFKGRVNLQGNAGFQRDNLDDAKSARMQRLIGNVSASVQVASWWSLNFSAANFSTNAYKVMVLEVDSLDYFQVTNNFNLSNSWNFGKGKLRSGVFSNLSHQQVRDAQSNNSTVQSAILGYSGTLSKLKTNFGVSANYFQTVVQDTNTTAGYGPTINIGKKFLRSSKLDVALVWTYLLNAQNSEVLATTNNLGLRGGYPVGKHHRLGIQANVIQQESNNVTQPKFTEYKATVNYGFTF